MINCEVIEESTIVSTYGFRFYDDEGNTVCVVKDVFTDAQKAESFKTVINESDIDAVHIGDIIDDIIGI